MSRFKYNYLMLALFFLIQASTFAQQRPPFNPSHGHNDHCSRTHTTNISGVAEPDAQLLEKSARHAGARALATCPTDAGTWASLSPYALVDQLKQSTDRECFSSFFITDPSNAPYIFSNANVEAVAREMYNMSASYNGTKASGLYGIVYYLHAAGYQDFYNPSITLNTNTLYWYRLACEYMTSNPNLFLLTQDALDILDEYLILLDFDGLREKSAVLNVVKRVLRDLAVNKTWKQLAASNERIYASAYNRVFFLMFRGMQDNNYINAVNEDANYFDLIYRVASDTELQNHSEYSFMTKNAVGELARMAESPLLIDDVEGHLAQIARNSERLSPAWLKSIEAINTYGNCASHNLCENMTQVKTELNNMLFPNTFSFDDGKMVVKTPLTEAKVQALYHAAKQVQNQFFRMLQTDQPVTGDINDKLNMVVFGSQQQYADYATYLYGIPTDNGGMYIERGATFYTWDRTVGVESSLSLEALFRHEYVHYLQGRYLIPGNWGESAIYDNSRLVWYEEGMAEFFAGSTDIAGIKLLASNASVVTNNSGNWPTLNTVFNSSYSSGNFHHYHYGNMIWYHWYRNDFGMIKTFFDLTRSNNVTGFDNQVNNLRYNSEQAFDNFLTQVANGTVQGWEPETQWLNDDHLAIGSTNDIKTEFATLTGITTTTASMEATALNRRFKITGRLSAQGGTSNADAAKKAGAALDNILIQLRGNELLNNFSYSIGHFKNLTYTSSSLSADFIITGPLRDGSVPDNVVPDFIADRTVTMTGGQINFSNKSSGYVKSLQWAFPGATPSSVANDPNPAVTYNSAGSYDVTLTATGTNGSQIKSKPAYIKVYAKSNTSYCAAAGNRSDNYVTHVSFGSIQHSSNHQPYSDFTSVVTELSAGTSKTLTIETRNSHWPSNAIGVWIDWNADGDFADAGEQIYNKIGTGPYSTTVNVPANAVNAVNAVTRMRIRVAYGGQATIVSCGTDTYIGEVEDYSLVIGGGGQTPPPPAPSYCSSSGSNSTYEYISNVQVGSFSNPSGAANYTDFTNLTINASKGSNNITLTPGFSGSAYQEYFRVWIDYNKDKDFDDAGELAFDAGSATTTAISGTINIPSSAPEGTTRMRVSMKYQSAPQPCGTTGDGEVEDYTINIGAGTVTVNAPSALSATLLTSGSVALSWTDNAGNEDGFEIERSAGSGSFAILASVGANITSYTDAAVQKGSTYSYRVRAKRGSAYSAYSNSSNVSIPAASYCAANNNGNPGGQYIKNVKIGTINNTSTYVTGGYSDYSSQVASISSSAALTVTPQTTWSGTQAKAWADWNRDGDFIDAGEEVLSAIGTGGSYTRTVYVPSGVTSGVVRLRVRVAYNETPTPCGSIYFSEVEDYTLNVNTSFAGPAAPAGEKEFTLFPNPIKGNQFRLLYPEQDGDMEISVYSLRGVMVYRKMINENDADRGMAEIQPAQHLKGTYMVRVKDRSATMVKIVIFE